MRFSNNSVNVSRKCFTVEWQKETNLGGHKFWRRW